MISLESLLKNPMPLSLRLQNFEGAFNSSGSLQAQNVKVIPVGKPKTTGQVLRYVDKS